MGILYRRTLLTVVSALLCLLVTHGGALAQASADDIARAKKHMAAGVAFIHDPDGARYEEAYPEFKKAYELSNSLNALQNLAICAMKLELDGEAIEYFETFLKEKGDDIDPSDKQSVDRDLGALKEVVAWTTLSSDKPGITVDDIRTPRSGEPVRNSYDVGLQQHRFGIHPGKHEFTARTGGGKELVWKVNVANGDNLTHEFLFDPNAPVTAEGFTAEDAAGLGQGRSDGGDEDGGGMPAAFWVVGGLTIAAAVPWAIFGAMSFSKKATYDDEILGKKPEAEQQDAFDDLKTTNLLADVFMGVTAAGAITTIIIGIVAASSGDDDDEGKTASHRSPKLSIAPSVDLRGGARAMATVTF